jgi:hypothetical protein
MDDVWARRDYSRYAGPVAQAFEHCTAETAVIIGPTGGGKTTAAARRILRVAQWQHPSPRDNIRKCRIGVVAPTYRRLWDQVIPSYRKEINPAWGLDGPGGKSGFSGSKGDPADHHFFVGCPDGIMARVEVLFRAVGDSDLEEFFRGFEVTGWWLPEMDTHASEDILSFATNRVGRYPEPDDRPENPASTAYAGVWGDANAPEIDDWFFNRFWLPGGRKAGDRVFIQPSGFAADHENRDNLRKINPNYYGAMAGRLESWAARRLVENKPGYSRHGLPVHDHFDLARMVVEQSIDAAPDLPLVIGADCGNTMSPAATFLQAAHRQVRALAEVCESGQQDLVEFARDIRRLRETRFAQVREAVIFCDPSARTQSVLRRGTSLAQILQAETGLEVILAPSNDPLARRGALDQVLKRAGAPGEPGFVVAGRDCPMLVKALAGAYHFAKKTAGKPQAPTPAKVHPYADIAESCQYGVLGMEGLGAAVAGLIHEGLGQGDYRDHRPILQE